MTIQALYQIFIQSKGVTTDTRNLKKGGLFFALKGDNFNGNKFAEQALNAGCNYAVIDEEEYATHPHIILVDNVLLALQKLANYHRKQFNIPVIGITGSNGKTTTKELAGAVLCQKYKTLITEGNLNNHLGVPFTLLRLNASHEIAIIEMGANKPGDIKELVDIAEPTHGIITNIGAAHIEGFGSIDGVIKTKKELYDFLENHTKTIFYNTEDTTLKTILPTKIESIGFGQSQGRVVGEIISQTPYVAFKWHSEKYQSSILETNLVGRYNFTNFLAAIAIGEYFKVDFEKIDQAILNYQPSNNRSQITKTKRNTIIVDCYNANATSMKAALESFVEIKETTKFVILGDMLELGDISMQEHKKLINFLEKNNLQAFLVGNEMSKIDTKYPTFENWKKLVASDLLVNIDKSLILLKGSRGIKLEELIPFL